jgi:hypothetical protein
MTDKEALLLALEALYYCEALNRDVDERKMQAITVIRKLWTEHAMQEVQRLGQEIEQEPVAWLLTDKNINSLQVDSIHRLINRLNHAHHTDLCVRINGQDEWFEADWLKHMVRAIPPQRTEQNPMPDEMLQAITDPENQPSQYGTVTLDYHFEKIKKWEDLFERMSNKVLAQPEQIPPSADSNTHQPEERNYCPRCGKRTKDIHTCTPPRENT